MTILSRRTLLSASLGTGAALAAPARLFAQARSVTENEARILDIARREVARAGDALWRRDIAGIADFSAHSSKPRFHFANLEDGSVRSFLVTHGDGSDPEHDGYLNYFSNVEGSNCTSRGAYVTWEWYKGRYGTSIRLGGLDESNNLALPRAIVMHSADYATQAHVDRWGRLGRSNGCFAMGPEDFREALWHLSGGRLLYADKLDLPGDGTVPPSPPIF
ncbi:murein L,D-transpeptidase catalytic domain-containing protein [Altericroceibacterium endophyticum]|uniref:Twin-arginine translocation pathway signal n=1 Tax=Altericroceibacterium endophyticum TaxID=1808508 RepID=A0A6I4T578_9SPHN|nr:murein L,D-transpeptidase catalytic domain family protein [Altericroceibacterium endophyticum]MXO65070.1 twin-arginine translocation pathway signal [Altericroceibacterium endophyticum]